MTLFVLGFGCHLYLVSLIAHRGLRRDQYVLVGGIVLLDLWSLYIMWKR